MIDIDIQHRAYGLDFVWSKKKSLKVRQDHGISFEDVVDVFIDMDAIEAPSNDLEGANLAMIGRCQATKVVYVAYCYRNGDHYIRLITARLADKKQRQQYDLARFKTQRRQNKK